MTAPDDVLGGLDPEQRAAALAVAGPVCILAGAGTGKTRAITHRIAYAVHAGHVPAGRVLAVTFTTRAAGELRSRLLRLGVSGVQARTFHAAALRQLRYFWPRLRGDAEPPELVDSRFRLVGHAAGRARLRLSVAEVRDLASEIEWAKASLVEPEGYPAAAAAAGRVPPRDPAQVAEVFAGYERAKQRAGAVDFDDLLALTAAGIEEHADVAAEVRDRYRHFVVDEYQDVSPLQQRLLDAWLGGRDDVCVVGDDDQTIYSFAGASRHHLLGFPERYPGATVVRLVRDYRSTPQVVDLANRLMAAGGSGKRLVGQRPPGPPPVFRQHPDEPAEAAWVAREVQDLVAGGVPASGIAVLYRVNAQSELYEAALAQAGVTYVVRGGERFFERAEVREALAALRAAAAASPIPADALPGPGPHTGPDAEPAGTSPPVDPNTGPDAAPAGATVPAGADAKPAGATVPADLHTGPDAALAGPAPLAVTVREVLATALGWDAGTAPAGGAALDRWEALSAVAGLAAEADPATTLAGFVAELERRAAEQHAPAVNGVTLASLHAAKGLEWDAVFLVGLTDGTLPIQHAATPDAVAEERRLLYVGVTRARERLYLSWALARAAGGRRTRKRSRFLDGLAPAVPDAARPARDRSERGRAKPGEELAPDAQAPFERLRAWRRERAAGLGQPAYCVFSDATLAAIATARPHDLVALAAVPGVGPTKLDKFGAEVLELVSNP